MTDTFPHPDMVARAIIAGCKETGANPIAVASGERCSGGPNGNYALSRARAYAAIALSMVWDGCGNTSIGRMIGSSSEGCYVASLRAMQRKGQMKWWREDALGRVIKAISIDEPARLRQDKYGPLNLRRAPVSDAEIVTATFMGDPSPGRSALDQKRAEQ